MGHSKRIPFEQLYYFVWWSNVVCFFFSVPGKYLLCSDPRRSLSCAYHIEDGCCNRSKRMDSCLCLAIVSLPKICGKKIMKIFWVDFHVLNHMLWAPPETLAHLGKGEFNKFYKSKTTSLCHIALKS